MSDLENLQRIHQRTLASVGRLTPRNEEQERIRSGIYKRLRSIMEDPSNPTARIDVERIAEEVKGLLQNEMAPAKRKVLWQDFLEGAVEGVTVGQLDFNMNDSFLTVPSGTHFVKHCPNMLPISEIQIRFDNGMILTVKRRHFPEDGIPVE